MSLSIYKRFRASADLPNMHLDAKAEAVLRFGITWSRFFLTSTISGLWRRAHSLRSRCCLFSGAPILNPVMSFFFYRLENFILLS